MQFPDVNDMPPGDAGRLLNLRSLLRAFLPGDRDTTRRSTGGSLLQALNLMNNPFVSGRIGANALTGTLFESLAMDDDELVANLYLTVLSRHPTVEETDHGVDYLTDLSGATTRRDRAVDLMWALFNKTEFYTNY